MELKNKKIILISPQPWGILRLSKHHYAIELSKMGNDVYFISPPGVGKESWEIKPIEGYKGLFEVTHNLGFRRSLRFRFRFIYDWLMQQHVRRFNTLLGFVPDITWCFEPNLYSNLHWFNAALNIYHPVDPITRNDQLRPSRSADIVFAVSEKILSAFNGVEVPKYFINHGLSRPFVDQAKLIMQKMKDYTPCSPIKVGYVGNLLRNIIDREVVLDIVSQQSEAEFHFWGPYEMKKKKNLGLWDTQTLNFIKALKSFDNVVLRGPKTPEVLAEEIQGMDLFFFTYKTVYGLSDRSNSHKILEYLSTGKPIISCPIDSYDGTGLLYFFDQGHLANEVFEQVFNSKSGYGLGISEKRIQYSLDNTYRKQISKVGHYLNKLK